MRKCSQFSMVLMVSCLVFSLGACNSGIQHAITETVSVNGDCPMCKTTIEQVGNKKGVVQVDWDDNSHTATLTYDKSETNKDDILKRIALAGYDNESYRAPDDAYSALPSCCQYIRDHESSKPMEMNHSMNEMGSSDMNEDSMDHSSDTIAHTGTDMEPMDMTEPSAENQQQVQTVDALKAVIEQYFQIKDALIASDAKATSKAAEELNTSLSKVDMTALSADIHTAWMSTKEGIQRSSSSISKSNDVAVQRTEFIQLTQRIYTLQKAVGTDVPLYYQFCPMANDGKGANWLSKEKVIENPYYGAMMLSCGKTVETIE